MSEKKLFPGITQEALDEKARQEREQAEKERSAKEAEAKAMAEKAEKERLKKEKANEDKARSAAHKKYVRPVKANISVPFGGLLIAMIGGGLFINALAMLSDVCRWCTGGFKMTAYNVNNSNKTVVVPWYRDLRSVWNPISDGISISNDGYSAEYYPSLDGKYDPSMFWVENSACLLIGACALIGFSVTRRFEEIPERRDRKAVDMMFDLEKYGKKYNLNTNLVKKLIKVAPAIISHMSKDKRVYFDMLMKGDIEIANNETFFDMARAIMEGHLKSHPEDMKIIMDTFAKESIPQDLLAKYAPKSR